MITWPMADWISCSVKVSIGDYSENRQLYVLQDGDETRYYYYEAASS